MQVTCIKPGTIIGLNHTRAIVLNARPCATLPGHTELEVTLASAHHLRKQTTRIFVDNRASMVVLPEFAPGDSAHTSINGDCNPCQVAKVSPSGAKVTVHMWEAHNIKGDSYQEGNRDCDFRPAPLGREPAVRIFRRGKDGRYREQGCKSIALGHGMAYSRNPSF